MPDQEAVVLGVFVADVGDHGQPNRRRIELLGSRGSPDAPGVFLAGVQGDLVGVPFWTAGVALGDRFGEPLDVRPVGRRLN